MSQAFVYDVHPNSEDSNQSSPAWSLVFIRWANRDPKNFKNPKIAGGDLAVLQPLTVINDCVSVTITSSKSSHTPSMVAKLRAGDINYMTTVAPGDFVFVNISNWSDKIDDISKRAKGLQAINEFSDGFKGFFKIQSVRQTISVNPGTGAKEVFFNIDAYGFTEFNNIIYFNPHMLPAGSDKPGFFLSNLSSTWATLFKDDGFASVQRVIKLFIRSFLGTGASIQGVDKAAQQAGVNNSSNYNTHFYVPSGVGSLLGQPNAKAAKDLYVYFMGVQKYSSGNTDNPEISMVPSNFKKKPTDGRFYETSAECQGRSPIKPDYWNQTPMWSILQQYLNSPINEMYVSYKPAPNGLVMPVFTMRQIPFTSEKYSGLSTKFLNLPRWRISPDLVYDINIGRDEALRLNFVQVFGNMGGYDKPNLSIAYQVAQGNYVHDINDIKRSGLRPYVLTSNFDIPSIKSDKPFNSMAGIWKNLLADCLIGGHLKLSGTLTCAGIEAPIAPGDNLELSDVVFHIESVIHSAAVQPNGQRTFRTSVELSNGVSKFSNVQKQVYGQMQNSKMELEKQEDFNRGDNILPGITDSESPPYSDPFYDTKASNHNANFDLPPAKTVGKTLKQGKSTKKSKKVAK